MFSCFSSFFLLFLFLYSGAQNLFFNQLLHEFLYFSFMYIYIYIFFFLNLSGSSPWRPLFLFFFFSFFFFFEFFDFFLDLRMKLCWDDKGNFLEPLRSARHVRHTTSPLHSDRDTTHNWELNTEGKLRSTRAHCANCSTTRRTAHEVRRSRDTDNPVSTGACHWTDNRQISILCGSQNIPLVYKFTYAHA